MEVVLKSWALPKGLPWKRGEKHLAVEVEDHPIEYEDFEGIIPEGQYGGGTVMVWDRWQLPRFREQPVKSLEEGKLHLVLDGEKAKGEWTLVRIRGRDDAKNQWLILKTGDDAKPISKKMEDLGENWTHHGANRKRSRCRVGVRSRSETRAHIAIQSTDSCCVKKKETMTS